MAGFPKKRVTKGMVSADGGEEGRTETSTTKKLNRPIAGLQIAQMQGGEEAEESKNAKRGKSTSKKPKAKAKAKGGGGGFY